MNKNIKIFLLCPVPEDQKPINEYIATKESFFTNWTTLGTNSYAKKIQNLFLTCLFLTCTFQISEFQGILYFFEWFMKNLWWSTILFSIYLFMILLRWIQLQQRFDQSRLFYEESSWYDGQIWEKPLIIIKNDKFITNQKIEPIIQRIKKSFFEIIALNLFSYGLLEISTN